jgi:hypothetical protein
MQDAGGRDVENTAATRAHRSAVATAEAVRQVASAPGASAATVKAADIAFHRAVIASALAQGVPTPTASVFALRELGVQS